MFMIDYFFSQQSLVLFIVAVVANALSAMAGGGAGLLQFPLLIFMGLPFGVALATHKIASVALGMGSTLRYAKTGGFEGFFCLIILVFALPGVVLGAVLILQVNETVATLCLGVLTLALGIYSVVQSQLGLQYAPKNRGGFGLWLGGIVIFIIGFINGSLTSGTGLFATLWFIYWFGMDYQRAVAMTMILVGIFWNGTGAMTLAMIGDVQWSWLAPLVFGSLVGGYIGANIAVQKGNVWMKRLFECLTIATGASLMINVLLLMA